MVREIVELLALDDWYDVSDRVDIAKGKYKIATSFSEGWKNRKRWQKPEK
jgi:hypothetical protein